MWVTLLLLALLLLQEVLGDGGKAVGLQILLNVLLLPVVNDDSALDDSFDETRLVVEHKQLLLKRCLHHRLALDVGLQTHRVEVSQEIFWVGVLLHLAILVENNHV